MPHRLSFAPQLKQANERVLELMAENAALRREMVGYLERVICTADGFGWPCEKEKARLKELCDGRTIA